MTEPDRADSAGLAPRRATPEARAEWDKVIHRDAEDPVVMLLWEPRSFARNIREALREKFLDTIFGTSQKELKNLQDGSDKVF